MLEIVANELLEYVFKHLPPKDLCTCRVVCWRWKQNIDYLTRQERLWRQHCQRDYPGIWDSAYKISRPRLSWYFLYRSLTLWSKLIDARIVTYNLAEVEHCHDGILDFYVLSDGVIGIHKREGIVYYDMHTLKKSKRNRVTGRYIFYRENDNILLTMDFEKTLVVTWKMNPITKFESFVTIFDVKTFFLLENIVYYVTLNNEMWLCKLGNSKIIKIRLTAVPTDVAALGYRHGYIYILTCHKEILKLDDKKLITVLNLSSLSFIEMFCELRKYSFQRETVFSFSEWNLCAAHHEFCEAVCAFEFCQHTVLYSYGHIVFSGSQFGHLHIYYMSETNNLLDAVELTHFKLIDNHHGFGELVNGIRQIHVVESYDSHIVLIATLKKITVLKFIHY